MSIFTDLVDVNNISDINEISLYGAERIGEYSFYGKTLNSIKLPKSVIIIREYGLGYGNTVYDCHILRTTDMVALAPNNFTMPNSKIYVPYDLFQTYKNSSNWRDIQTKVFAYKTFELNEVFPKYDDDRNFYWYPSKANLVANTNGRLANGTNKATSAGEWYCKRVPINVTLISSPKTTTFVKPTVGSVDQTEYIPLDTWANGAGNITINAIVTDYTNDTVSKTTTYTNKTLPAVFDNSATISGADITVKYYDDRNLEVFMNGIYSSFGNEYWQQIQITSVIQNV